MSYAIVKHRFLDIHLIVARSVAYALLILIIAVVYVGGIYTVATVLLNRTVPLSDMILPGMVTLGLILTFQPLRKLLEKATAKIFYRQMYSTQTLLWNLSRIMSSTLDINQLVDRVLHELLSQMSIGHARIILLKDDSIIWQKEAHPETDHLKVTDKQAVTLIKTISQTALEQLVVFDEMHESEEKEIMRAHGISVVMVLAVENRIIGGIFLSEKASGDIYSTEDISVFKIIAPEIAVAIQNALSYDEIKKFNKTLQSEVKKATESVRFANEQMYKKNLELSQTNRTLSLLRAIDEEILTSVTDTEHIAQMVADTIVKKTDLKGVTLVLYDKGNHLIKEIATAPQTQLSKIEQNLKIKLHGLKTATSNRANIFVKAIHSKKMQYTHVLYDIMRPHITRSAAEALSKELGETNLVVYPMIVHGEVIGAISLSLPEPYTKLSTYMKDLINRLVNITGIAIDNALLYQRIQEANERLRQLDVLKDEFVSVASHELRTPMTAIKSYLWLALAGKGGALTAKQKYYLDRSYSSTTRLIKLVNDMLNVSRIESGRMSFEIQKLILPELVEEVLAEVLPRAQELGVTIKKPSDKEIAALKLPPVLADPDKIKEIVINLIGNSLKFTPRGGTISLTFEKKSGFVITSVSDTGEGIEQDDIPKLFQKFSLVRGSYQTNKQSSQGTGLGLYICKMIMKEHGGDIWAESAGRGKGATFRFQLKKYSVKELLAFKKLSLKEGLGIIHTDIQ